MSNKPKKNTTALTLIIAAVAILYFAYNLKSKKIAESPELNAKQDSKQLEQQIDMLGELSPPVVENSLNQASSSSAVAPTETKLTEEQVGIDLNNIPEDLPEDLKQQLTNPPELPDDLKAQLEAPPPEIPADILEAMSQPPREVTEDEVNNP